MRIPLLLCVVGVTITVVQPEKNVWAQGFSAGQDKEHNQLAIVVTVEDPQDGRKCNDGNIWQQLWLVKTPQDAHTAIRTKILEPFCYSWSDGMGYGSTSYNVSYNSLTIESSHALSNNLSSTESSYQLSPFKLLKTKSTSSSRIGNWSEEITWYDDRNVGYGKWWIPVCQEDGSLLEECDVIGADGWNMPFYCGQRYEGNLLPQVRLDDAFLAGNWKTSSWDACASPVVDSNVTAVMSLPKYLFVKVKDTGTEKKANPQVLHVADDKDYLEIWLTDLGQDEMKSRECVDTHAFSMASFKIDIASGKVSAGYNSSSKILPQVEMERLVQEKEIRFKITFPQAMMTLKGQQLKLLSAEGYFKGRLTIARNRVNKDGAISIKPSSTIRINEPATLGLFYPVSCQEQNGKLENVSQ